MGPRAIAKKTHTANEIAIRDPGGTENDRIAAHEVVGRQDPVKITKSHLPRTRGFIGIARL